MSAEGGDPVEPPSSRRERESWSLRTIVEDVSGHTLEDYQDPARTPHPYLGVKPPLMPRPSASPGASMHAAGRGAYAGAGPEEEWEDPVARYYPPFVGAVGRQIHGPEHEHHTETLRRLAYEPGAAPGHPASPARRPERVYLHYLLLHLDRLSDHALRYLRHAIDDELLARARPPEPPAPPAEVTAPEQAPVATPR